MCAVAYYSAKTSQQSLIANSTILCRLTMDGEYNLDEEVTIIGMWIPGSYQNSLQKRRITPPPASRRTRYTSRWRRGPCIKLIHACYVQGDKSGW